MFQLTHLGLSPAKLGHRIFRVSLILAHQLLVQALKISSIKQTDFLPTIAKIHLTGLGCEPIIILVALFPDT